jgi:hypothetical protein
VKADRPQKHKARARFSGIYRRVQHPISVIGCRHETKDSMRARIRQIGGVAATIAVALHTILWVAVAPFAAPAVDPFTVICHSNASAAADQAPVDGPLPPAHACDHCSLCIATTPPSPLNVVTGTLAPARVLQVLGPTIMTARRDTAADPKLARGPPAFA